jgi:pimeloyl-ACP methyl ester carboxylesterase
MNWTKIKKIMNVLLFTLLLVALLLTLFLCFLWIKSPGKPTQFRDKSGKVLKGSISEKVFVTIGGVKQGMFIMGKDVNNPVLLYLHGGPAFPNYFLIEKYNPGLEDHFTVCYWEQRGGGLSYTPEVSVESMTLEQLISDAVEVTNYLRNRFGKEKIYLMAHSGGTPVGIQAAAKNPELYYAYIGMAQITRQVESEKIAYSYMLGEYLKAGNQKAVNELKKFKLDDSDSSVVSFYKSMIRDQSMHELGIGTMRNMRSVLKGVFIPVWMCKAYTLGEKWNIWKSKFTFLKRTTLFNQLFALNIPVQVPELKIPVYFFSGKYDLTVNYELAKAYLNQLKAPVKGFYTFEESAHSPLYEEPEKVKSIMKEDVLHQTNGLADQ